MFFYFLFVIKFVCVCVFMYIYNIKYLKKKSNLHYTVYVL